MSGRRAIASERGQASHRAAAVSGRGGIASERGQAAVELVGMLPLLVAVALTLGQFLAAGAAQELAGHAAGAGAMALGRGADAREAARDALPGWSRDRLAVDVQGRRVTATVEPLALVPPLAKRLRASATADAGPPGEDTR